MARIRKCAQLPQSGNILKFLFLPDGEDPDSYVRKYGKADFEQQVANATPLSQYLFENLIELHQINLGSHEGKSALRAVATPLIDKFRILFTRGPREITR